MICLDASVAVKLIIDEEYSEKARALYRQMLRHQEPIVAPPLLSMEVTNIVRQQMRGRDAISLNDATIMLDDFLALDITLHFSEDLHREALVLAAELELPATYDAHYLAFSARMDCDFWTADRRLLRQIGNQLHFARWIGDYVTLAES